MRKYTHPVTIPKENKKRSPKESKTPPKEETRKDSKAEGSGG